MRRVAKRFSLLILLPFTLAVGGWPPLQDPYPRQPGIDAEHYVFRIVVQDGSDHIEGEADIALRFLQEGVSGFFLDLAGTDGPSDGKGMEVTNVLWQGGIIPWTHEEDHLQVTLPEAPPKGELGRLTVRYGGEPADGLKIGPNRYGDRTFFSVNWPNKARHWLPMIDHPSDKATSESSLRPQAITRWWPMGCSRRRRTWGTDAAGPIGSSRCPSRPGSTLWG